MNRRSVDPGGVSASSVDETAALRFHGRLLQLRRLRAEDRASIAVLLGRVEPEDLRMRFFTALPQVTAGLLDRLLSVDPARLVSVVAHGVSDGAGEILGVARAHLLRPDTAELALLVRSDLKGMGLGTALLARLIERCRQRGIDRLVADVLPENVRMLRLAHRFGFCRAPETSATQSQPLLLALARRSA